MDLKNLVAISGYPGVFKMVASRKNGMIVKSIESGKAKFVPSRKHEFHALQTIGIYQEDGDTMDLKYVFRNMLQQIEDNPPVSAKAGAEELREYFTDIMPNHDDDKVSINDIKKIIKWFNFLNEHNYIDLVDDSAEDATSAEGGDEEE